MKKQTFHVEIFEITTKVFETKAESYDEAEAMVQERFEANKISLHNGNFYVEYKQFIPS